MTVTEFLDTKLEKGTHDIIIVRSSTQNIIDYDVNEVLEVHYIKVAVLELK